MTQNDPLTHDEAKALLASYALDAVTPLERARIERHLDVCDDCAHEVRLLGETVTELSILAGSEQMPPELVDRIVDAVPSSGGAWRWRTRALSGVAAAAAIIAIVAGGFWWRERDRVSDLDRRLAAMSEVISSADRTVELAPREGFPGSGRIYLDPDTGRAVVALDGVPRTGPDLTLQLWSIGPHDPRSMGLLEGEGRVVAVIDWDRSGETFAVTAEPAEGSEQPTTDPILLGA